MSPYTERQIMLNTSLPALQRTPPATRCCSCRPAPMPTSSSHSEQRLTGKDALRNGEQFALVSSS